MCLAFLIGGFVYCISLPFFWGNNPLDPLGTMSILCANHRSAFWLWVALVTACGIALTLGYPVDSWNLKRIIHWICTGTYVALLGFSVAGLGIVNFKKNKNYRKLTIAVIGVAVLFVVWFLVFGKSAVLEMIPYALLQAILFVANFTDILKLETDKKTNT